jgi:hypothetical protein
MKRIEEHLYEHQHTGKDGVTTTRYYAKFVSWDRRPLTIALGDDLAAAGVKLDRLHKLNDAKVTVELDETRELREELERQKKQKADARKGITFAEWAQKYFDELVPPEKRASTVHQESSRIKTLNDFFGDVPLCSINLDMILQYRKERAAEVGLATVNLGVSFLRYLLNMAADHGVLDSVPRIKLRSEKDREQQRSVELDEYRLILASLNQPH